jgi:TonB-dependent SusC/RagA subfamily outer membrane receptor
MIGMIEEKIIVNNKMINVSMKEEILRLNEIVVTGYGLQKKKSATGSVSRIISNDINSGINANLLQSLEGRVAGVQVTNAAGASPSIRIRGVGSINGKNDVLIVVDGVFMTSAQLAALDNDSVLEITILKDAAATALYGSRAANGVMIITTKKGMQELTQVKARTNFSETAFFFPNLKTDSQGKVSFNFMSPEALTEWKLRLYAHDKNATVGYLEKSVITQKDIMVVPNFPRFFREKDSIVITTKVSNITTEAKTGMAILQLFDATTGQPIDAYMLNKDSVKNFNINPLGNTTVSWKIYIPEGVQAVQYKVLAKAGNFSDGEENIVPVLTNNMLVTESIPVWVRENSKKEYTFEHLKNNNSTTLRNHQFTLEYTSNPTWMAIQSLPYLMEYEHECAEQTFARYYANALASDIINSNPKIGTVFESWQKNGKLEAKLEQNEELKSILLAETPWMMDAKSEDEKKQNLALLFDLDKMKNSLANTFSKLKQKQKSSGGFVWFDGGEESEYITRHILAGFGHLQQLKIKSIAAKDYKEITEKGISFIDAKFMQSHQYIIKNQKDKTKFGWYNAYSDIHYLYTRSFYLKEYPLTKELSEAIPNYLNEIKTNWLTYSLYQKGMAALILSRFKEDKAAVKIIESLKETASNNEDWGMYWIENKSGWHWYQAPIETQALLIEAFAEVTHDTKAVDAMKVWLLKNKQTKNWPTTKSTTEAIYALLMQGTDWLSVKDNTIIKIGDQKLLTKKMTDNQKEAETGYMKLTWKADEVKKEMATISIENKSKVPGFGGIYWQYFEDLDHIKNDNKGVLAIAKELYLKKNLGKGDELQKITSQNILKIGDLVTVRLVISTKEDMEFVHLKDMRAACFEPISVLSEYEWKDGLGYYRSTKDVATHFFFDQIKKGTYVLEYDIRVNNSGDFSNGITTIQSMYAPEFSSHTKGIRVSPNSN